MIRKWLKPGILISALVLVLAVVAAACGGDDATARPPATQAPAATTAPQPTSAPGAQVTPTASAGAFRGEPTPTTSAAVPTATAVPVEARGEPKVETLVIAVDPAAGETNLPWAGTVDHHQQMDLVMEVLVDINPDTNLWVPELAKSWTLSEDGTEWTFLLEEGVQWHNNWGEFTTADVFHSAKMNQREDAILAYANDWRQIDLDASTIINDHEFTFKLLNPNPDYLFYISPSGGGLQMSKAQWDAGGDEAYEDDMIGTGPYRFTGRTFGVNVTYDLLPDHWRRGGKDGLPPPDFQKIDLRWIKEVATRNAGLLAEDIHLTELTRDLADAAVANQGMKVIASNFPGNQVNMVFPGQWPENPGEWAQPRKNPDLPFHDVKVREAMNRAIDKQLLIDSLFSGRVTRSPQIGYYEGLPGWDPRWLDDFEENYGYDPEKARALLAEAGYPDGFNMKGIVMNIFGFPEAADLVQAIAVMMDDVGIDVSLEEWEFGAWLPAWFGKEDSVEGIWSAVPSFKTVFAQLSLFNRSTGVVHLYETEELDALFDELQSSADPVERDRIQREAGDILYDDYAYMPLFYIFIEFVANPDIIDQWTFPGSDGANYGHFDRITACTTPEPCLN